PEVGRKIELHRVETRRSHSIIVAPEGAVGGGQLSEPRLENRAAHAQRLQLRFHPALEFSAVTFTPGAQALCLYEKFVECELKFPLGLDPAFREPFESGDLLE